MFKYDACEIVKNIIFITVHKFNVQVSEKKTLFHFLK